MRRRLLNLLTLLSLLLCVTIAVLWLRRPGAGLPADYAYGLPGDVWYPPGQTRYFIESNDGLLCLGRHGKRFSSEAVCVPHWVLLVMAAALPAVRLVLRARRGGRRRIPGFEVGPRADEPLRSSPGPSPMERHRSGPE